MPNTEVNKKDVRRSKKGVENWIALAEDAEQDIERARQRIKQLREAARIFRRNAENGEPCPGVPELDRKEA